MSCAVSSSLRPYTTVWWLHNATPVVPSELLHVTGKHLLSEPSVGDLMTVQHTVRAVPNVFNVTVVC